MSVIKQKPNEKCVSLLSPTAMGQASAFLWNSQMMIQMSCRGFATAQYMHPEPRKYAYAPTLEAQSFMQPEQPHYAHHPGRFFYIKDHSTDTLFSAPYEPVRTELDEFEFISGQHYLAWRIVKNEIAIEIKLSLSRDHAAELWSITLTNHAKSKRKLDVTPYFPVGYMSWMNQSGAYDDELQAIVCRSVTPYQKVVYYPKIKKLKDFSYLLAETKPSNEL